MVGRTAPALGTFEVFTINVNPRFGYDVLSRCEHLREADFQLLGHRLHHAETNDVGC